MRSIVQKIKDTFFHKKTLDGRDEAILRLRYLDHILFDFEFCGDFYTLLVHIFKRYAQVSDGLSGEDEKKLQNRIDFLASALEDSIQLGFEAWAFERDITYCDCENYYSNRGWYDFYYIAMDLLDASVSDPEFNPEESSSLITERLRRSIITGKEELGQLIPK